MGASAVKHPECLVSIVTIVFNGEMYIEQTINSVLGQKYSPIEYIIIDGGSTDGTSQKIGKYKNRIDHFISEPDDGIYYAINKGISFARGDLIGLIHCGDYYESDAVSDAVGIFLDREVDVIYGNLKVLEEAGKESIIRIVQGDHNNLKKRMSILHPATFVSRRCYLQHGLYDTQYKSAADYDFFLKLFLSKVKFHHVDTVLANFRSGGTSGSNFSLAMRENLSIRQNLLGNLHVIKYLSLCGLSHYYFTGRKWFIEKCIGKSIYLKLKHLYYARKSGL